MSSSPCDPCPCVYNYAIPGATVADGLSVELARFFAVFPKKDTPTSEPSLNPAATLYGTLHGHFQHDPGLPILISGKILVLWLGINDCG
jgi:hypothetical protein